MNVLSTPVGVRRMTRRASTGNLPIKLGSLIASRIDENQASGDLPSNRQLAIDANSSRCPEMNCPSHMNQPNEIVRPIRRTGKRFGFRTSIDLSGEFIKIYADRGRGDNGFTETARANAWHDETDDLKSAVVIEVLLRTSHVAHYLQNFDNMTRWMSHHYKELVLATNADIAIDPHPDWFSHQCRVMEGYITSLASDLHEMGVFGAETGLSFTQVLENNLDLWRLEGKRLQAKWYSDIHSEHSSS